MPLQPTICQEELLLDSCAIYLIALIGLLPDLLPKIISLIIIGMPIIKIHPRYIKTKAPPPLVPALYGNPQIFPSPTADPVAAKIKVHCPIHDPCNFNFRSSYKILF